MFSRDCGGKEIVLGGENHSFNKHVSSTHSLQRTAQSPGEHTGESPRSLPLPPVEPG